MNKEAQFRKLVNNTLDIYINRIDEDQYPPEYSIEEFTNLLLHKSKQ